MINGKKLAEAGFKYLGVPYSQMDCQAFIEQCLRDCGLDKNLAGSNAWYREVMNNGEILTPEECVKKYKKAPAGAFLFILNKDGGEPSKYKSDNLGNASHIGLVTEKGEGAIHSSATRGAVSESKFNNKTINGGWNKVGLWNQVELVDHLGSKLDDPLESGSDRLYPSDPPEAEGTTIAVVTSDNGNPVNTRKGPGKEYPQSKAGKLPAGTEVQVLKTKADWSYIKHIDQNKATWYCWINTTYLTQPQQKEGEEENDPANPPADNNHCGFCVPGCVCQQP